MKIFVDTNIFLDLILKREKFHDALLIFNEMISKALEIENNDLEDTLQYLSAKDLKSDCIITNDKSFYKSDIETLSNSEFIKKYL